ncbi:glycosyltransferase family 2 protein [Clostridium estertheticum]|uniref:glycosyltransferase family 2 protein n=1 Tax=Clostridium estertheticum TaxID=238834 RepID=UPI001C0C9946|nr:glycosyltransferase family 2 protein [Clostridium estertheticum]MBU3073199.1 glycosyltransferase family 2 protein [Clostridium estertheticum]MBU3163560.1 glycosyltransferase family 2 protein [Clostridium estertheticum]
MDSRAIIIDKEPDISVIIPSYNSEKTIEYALSSLEKQTYDNFEVILINDGSEDNSDKIIKGYLRNSGIKCNYIIQENSGVSVARNVGLTNAKGKYIMFLDADDVYHKDFIKILSDSLKQNDVDSAYCCYSRNFEKLYSDTKEICIKNVILKEHTELMNSFMYRKGPCGFTTFIYKKSIIDKYNVSFTQYAKYGEDLEFTWKYLSHCKIGAFVNIPLYGYYDNPNSAVNNISWGITEALDSVQRVENYFKEQNNTFYEDFKEYMTGRTLLAILKDFSKYKRKDLFERVVLEYNPKIYISRLISTSNMLIKILGVLFIISPRLFYWLIQLVVLLKL